MEAPHDPLYAGFHPQGHPLGALGLIEPLEPLTLDSKKVRAFFETQKVWSAYNSVGMCDFVGAPLNALGLQRLQEGIGTGGSKGSKIDPDEFFAARRTYYEMAGWDPSTGRPTAAKLAELGVEEAAAGQK